MTIGMGGAYVVVIALKPIAFDLGWPRAAVSLCYSLVILGAGIGGPLMGWWSDRCGIWVPALFGALMISVGALLASVGESKLELYLAHGLFMGLLGNAVLMAPLLANVADWFDRRRGIAVAFVAVGQSLAGALWPPLFRPLVEDYGWRWVFGCYAVVAVCTLVPLSLALCPQPPARLKRMQGDDNGGIVLGLPPGLVQVRLWVAASTCFVATAVPVVHLVSYATDLGFSSSHAVELLSLLLACAVISRLAFGLVADQFSGFKPLLFITTGQAVVLTGFIIVDKPIGLYIITVLFGLVYGGIMPGFALVVRELFVSGQAGRRIGTVMLFGAAGMAFGGWSSGFVFDVTGTYRGAFAIGVAFNLVAVVLLGELVRRQAIFKART